MTAHDLTIWIQLCVYHDGLERLDRGRLEDLQALSGGHFFRLCAKENDRWDARVAADLNTDGI